MIPWGPLSDKESREAEEYLRNHPEFNYEAWQNRESPKEIREIFEKKFGPSKDCLSLSSYLRLTKILDHLSQCNSCYETIGRLVRSRRKK